MKDTLADSDWQQLLNIDRSHIWHPYSRCHSDMPLFPVRSAEGCYLTLADGKRIFDGMSSWWSAIHGYKNPVLDQALHAQVANMSHVMFGGLTHEPAIQLARKLVDITPEGLSQVFFSDSGSVAVEVAMKMALQYWQAQGKSKTKFLALRSAYHGDTFAAMSVCDPVTGMHQIFSEFMTKNIFAPSPECAFDQEWDEKYFKEFKTLAEQHQNDIAAIILEPIVQGTGGMHFYSPSYLARVRELCDQLNIPLIADEIATGFGRTGKLFACEHANISPDILCLGKALTGGYMTLAATLCTENIATTICSGEAGVFMHGPTFMANPLACSVANASIDLLEQSNWQANVNRLETALRKGLEPCKEIKGVNGVRCLGAIGVIELKEVVDMARIQPMFVEQGIWIRPFGKLVYTMPPFIAKDEEIEHLCLRITQVLNEYLKR
ncbi:MAG: adenosylmethionine--8-amino-7-oxononanoate transaminase [Agarilytica sp.]